ncbi:flagellar hook-basal body complex protein FliE [Azospirillum formosense]|uniref:Flagellar hook-basal body complex protein FliE n=1 Tax=Azospirillum formosense TaxID=861533 RepID=A0ABX2L2N5_9PROT|nr:flagellar hook-basal body complex protein FliE [Azospirillum formosense]MBY3753510.1 flagellar hook-basal body complex protein FliE [Azospirillum formosense]NUB20371.1 flagellar hook-basal body complex protein FliE [Azospirillum formosense]
MINPINAAAAYANTAASTTGPGMAPRNGVSFGDVLEQTAKEVIGDLKQGETMTAKAAVGQADLTDVVQAVTNAEVTLQTVTAVRDKVLSAYQEILRMPI